MSTEVEITIEAEPKNPATLSGLMAAFNDVKKEDSKQKEKLTTQLTLKGMESINELIADAMQEINEFTSNGEEESFLGRQTSKALAVLDSDNKWVGKWFKGKRDDLAKEELKQKTPAEIVQVLRSNIEKKREEVVNSIQMAVETKKQLILNTQSYEQLKSQADALLSSAEEFSREEFDIKRLITNLITAVEKSYADIKTYSDMIAAGSISVSEIDNQLPTIEHDLDSVLGVKVFQQQLADFNDLTSATVKMVETATSKVKQECNITIQESLKKIGANITNVSSLKKIAEIDEKQASEVKTLLTGIQDKVNKNFKEITDYQAQLTTKREQNQHTLLSGYSE